MSAYGSLAAAREVWDSLRRLADQRGEPIRVGYYIAQVELVEDRGFSLEDLGEPDQHLTIWGDRNHLAEIVSRIYSAETEE